MNQRHESVYIPEGIQFGSKVVVIPSVSMAFSHSGNMKSEYKNTYVWIDRGDSLGHYTIEADKTDIPLLKLFYGTETKSVSISSPVSGLLIHATYDFATSNSLTAVLLPDDEPGAQNGEYIFRNLCRLCSRYKNYFLKPSRYWSLGARTEEQFENHISEQLSKKCEIVDALPKYKDYFDDIIGLVYVIYT